MTVKGSVWKQHSTCERQNQIRNDHIPGCEKCFITFHSIMIKYGKLRTELYCRKLKIYESLPNCCDSRFSIES